jgi:hypothetical protein
MSHDFKLTTSRVGPAVLLCLEGSLTPRSTAVIIEQLGQMVGERGVLVDLRAVIDVEERALARLGEYADRAARGPTAIVFITASGSEADRELAEGPSASRICVVHSTASSIEAIVELTLYQRGAGRAVAQGASHREQGGRSQPYRRPD